MRALIRDALVALLLFAVLFGPFWVLNFLT